MKKIIILFCHCVHHHTLPEAMRRAVREAVAARGIPIVDVPDLCGVCADGAAALKETLSQAERVAVAACHPRALRWLLHAAGCALPPDTQFLNLRTASTPELLAQVDRLPETASDGAVAPPAYAAPAAEDWPPWFPIIDESRCSRCGQCVSFCLFGVYTRVNGRVTVTQPHHCKNNCPACARICPEAAIIFPKLSVAEAPLDGDEIRDETAVQGRAHAKLQEILGDDPMTGLAARSQLARARRLKRPSEWTRAEAERDAHRSEHPADREG